MRLLKVVVFTMSGTVQFLESVELPGFLAYVTVAGVLPIAGYRTRLVALASLPILLGAAWVHLPNGWVCSASNGGWEYPVFLAVAAIVQALIGDGAYALSKARAASVARAVRA